MNKCGYYLGAIVLVILSCVSLVTFVEFISSLEDNGDNSVEEEVYYPEPTNYVVDTADVIDEETEKSIIEKLTTLNQRELGEIVVVTVKTTKPLEIEQYAIELAEQWQVGDRERDDGIIFILATDDRATRIEVGRGMEARITDAKAGEILDNYAIPSFSEDKWEEGIKKIVDALMVELGGGDIESVSTPTTDDISTTEAVVVIIMILLIIVMAITADEVLLGGLIFSEFSSTKGNNFSFGGGNFSGGGSSRSF